MAWLSTKMYIWLVSVSNVIQISCFIVPNQSAIVFYPSIDPVYTLFIEALLGIFTANIYRYASVKNKRVTFRVE